LSQITCDFFLN